MLTRNLRYPHHLFIFPASGREATMETPPVTDLGTMPRHGDNFQTYDPRMIMAWNDWVVPLQKKEDGSYPTPQGMLPLWNAFQSGWRARDGK